MTISLESGARRCKNTNGGKDSVIMLAIRAATKVEKQYPIVPIPTKRVYALACSTTEAPPGTHTPQHEYACVLVEACTP